MKEVKQVRWMPNQTTRTFAQMNPIAPLLAIYAAMRYYQVGGKLQSPTRHGRKYKLPGVR